MTKYIYLFIFIALIFLSSIKISNEICLTKRRVWTINFLDMLFDFVSRLYPSTSVSD